ncbi:nitroreductase family protein [Burkholderia humptydooensis]|uniref:nitroreductase family protein n=1 Tax=Burkholderia humptydooensis TaxID=430531 RepID=UPI0003A540A8|nr:nitroreductase family protein [Burkholderia humptydooensis]
MMDASLASPSAGSPIVGEGSDGASSTLAQIRQIVESVLGVAVPDHDTNIIGLGANSMELVRIINRIEDSTGVRIGFDALNFSPSVAMLAASVDAARGDAVAPPAPPDAADIGGADERRVGPVIDALRDDAGWPVVRLAVDAADSPCAGSVRTFRETPLELAQLARLLGVLAQTDANSPRRAAYASAGARYPVQAYLYVKAGAVAGLSCGLYYFHPTRGELWLLAPDLVIDGSLYDPLLNAEIHRQAAFSIHLVSRPAAIEPMYGARARDYSLLEAGAMAQLLRMRAPSCGIGLCAIGDFAFEPVRGWFELDEGQACLHTLLGGLAP